MAKKNIHPKLNKLIVTCTNGQVFETEWTLPAEELNLLADPFNHPAWTGEFALDTNTGRAAAFLNKFATKK